MSKNKKRHRRNMSISTRLTITTVMSVVIPVILIATFGSVFSGMLASYFNISTVTTNSYSTINLIQWSSTMSSISDELVSNDTNEKKLSKVQGFVEPIEKIGSLVYIECDNTPYYATANKADIVKLANEITNININQNSNYFGENGMVIVNHAQKDKHRYTLIITNKNYKVHDVTNQYSPQNFLTFFVGRTGVLITIVAAIFILSIISMSLITSGFLKKPLKKLSKAADEIANGNLDCVIDYQSTNELGKTVKSFNHMSRRLKTLTEERNRIEESRKEMIAGLAHDLRTPLTSAKGYVEGLIDGIANTPEKREQYLKTIYSSTCDMEKLLDELLTVSKLESDNIQLDQKTIRANDFLDDCRAEISDILAKNDFDFEYSNNCDDDVFIDIDVDRFERVIKNIISNSIKYKRKDVKGKVTLSAESYQKSIIISIADNGIGLDPKDFPKIFDTFYRADKARSNVSNGSGIGLSVCRRIIEMHGGRIWATGSENNGLTILISLDRRRDEGDEQKNIDC